MLNLTYWTRKIPGHLWVASSGWISRIINAGIQIISIPILFKVLGLEEYAAFSIIIGLIAWFNLADLGLGTTLQNMISEYRVKNQDIQVLLSKIPALIFFLLIIECILFVLISSPLQRFLFANLNFQANILILPIAGVLYLICAIFSVSYKYLFAQHQGYLAYFYQTLGNIIGFLLILWLYFFKIKVTLLSSLVLWILPQTIFAIVPFFLMTPMRDFFSSIDFIFYKRLLGQSWKFFFVMLTANGVLAIDYIIISHILSAQDIINYSTINRIYALISFGYGAVLLAIWPVLAEKYMANDVKSNLSANKEILTTIAGGIIYVMLATLMFLLAKPLILKILGLSGKIELSDYLVLLFCIYTCLRVWVDTHTVALQSRGKMRLFIWTTPLQAIITIPMMIIGVKMLGLYGVIWALILSFLFTSAWIVPLMHYRSLKIN